jgi:hypothetical protein
MTDSNNIVCPNCKFEIEVTEVLSAQLRGEIRKEFEAEQRKKDAQLTERENALQRQLTELQQAKATIEQQVADKLEKERQQLSENALKKAKEQVAVELQDSRQQLEEIRGKLKSAEQTELELRKERRQLAEQKEALELTVTRKLDEERAKIREAAKKEAADERQLKDAEKDKLVNDLRTQIEELRRKSEQGSQQTQGEVLELVMEDLLRRTFPFDTIQPVAKGVHGGDVIQIVHDATGAECGIILWESKRTKAWSDGWLPKLRDDQRAAKAHVAILISIEMPKGVTTFECVDGVWVTCQACALALAAALRSGMIDAATARRAGDGKQTKMELLYAYLSGQEFRHRVEGIVEAFVTMKSDLESEKRAMQRSWAKREKQLERAIANTSGMYGDLQGIVGASLPSLPSLEHPLLESQVAQDGDPDVSAHASA